MDSVLLKYKKKRIFCKILIIFLIVATLLIAVFSVGKGAVDISFKDTARIIYHKSLQSVLHIFNINHPLPDDIPANLAAVIWDIRLPRIVCGIFVGAGLAVAGAIFQSILNNPLADPYTLGVSTGASFGASLAILLGILYDIYLPTTVFALAFALLTLMFVIFISYKGGGIISANLIIAGIIVSSIFSAGISFMKMLAGEDVGAIVFWIMGSLNSTDKNDILVVFLPVIIVTAIAVYYSNNLNIMTLGRKSAESLGINAKKTSLLFLILASVLTAVCVSVCGVIGFIGLVVPHIIRIAITVDNKYLLPISFLMGGMLLSLSDTVVRLISNGVIPVGVLTTLLGGPFFIWLFIRQKGAKKND